MLGIHSIAMAPLRLRHQLVTPLLMAALGAAPVVMSACAGRKVYDPYYRDYHRWNRSENGNYLTWENETRRPHLDFEVRPVEEQQIYFVWRHRR